MAGFGDGKRRLSRKLLRMTPQIEAALKAQNASNAAELVQTVRGFIPVDKGVLRESVRHEDTSTGQRITQTISVGGAATTKQVGTRTYDREVSLGSGDTAGRKKKAGGEGVTYDYALAQEYGTADMPANPALWPAWRLKRRRMKTRMSRAAKKAALGVIK